MSRRRSQSATVALFAVTLAVGGGLFAMHVITTVSSPSTDSAHVGADIADAKPNVAPAMPEGAGGAGHLDALLECVWVAIGSVVLIVATAWAVQRTCQDHRLCNVVRRIACSVQRAPPSSVRLSLVGIARC